MIHRFFAVAPWTSPPPGQSVPQNSTRISTRISTRLSPLRLILAIVLGMILAGFPGAAPLRAEPTNTPATAIATFAGGCFWCMEPPFDALPGVLATTSGYTGGTVVNPTYKQVSGGGTGHLEAVQVTYDPRQVSYGDLLAAYWRNVDPLDGGGQFCDRGDQYRTAIFYHSPAQEDAAQQSQQAIAQTLGVDTLATRLVAATPFYEAEDYHQDYYQKQPLLYHFYRYRCGRDRRLEQLWGQALDH